MSVLALLAGFAAQPAPAETLTLGNDSLAKARAALQERGLSFSLLYTSDLLGNVSGGVRRGARYAGKVNASVSADLDKLFGWQGLTFYSNVFQIHRTRSMRDDHFHGLITISNIEAKPTTRLSEFWLERKFFDDRFSIRFGQLAADEEFFISSYSLGLLSNDWPAITGANLPAGGPAYPLATPGIRFKFEPTPAWSALFGVFNGNPGEEGTVNRTGTNFRVNDPPLVIGEVQHRYNHAKEDQGLARTIRLGAWHHFGKFEDQHFDSAGLSLANPLSSGLARQFRGTSGIYGVIDQQLYRPKGGGPDSGIGVFARVFASPADRSVISLYVDGGFVFTGPFASRRADKLNAGFIYARVSEHLRSLDHDSNFFTGIAHPVRNHELIFELNYQIEMRAGWMLQPLVQYIVHPGGHISDPHRPEHAIRNGALIGIRSTMTF
ncbi:MAG TPA: carbohydrate porin [Xanthobacteraceae bacterium]|nr:carbohydrate porin [Xanthobacteraceae bacterium]